MTESEPAVVVVVGTPERTAERVREWGRFDGVRVLELRRAERVFSAVSEQLRSGTPVLVEVELSEPSPDYRAIAGASHEWLSGGLRLALTGAVKRVSTLAELLVVGGDDPAGISFYHPLIFDPVCLAVRSYTVDDDLGPLVGVQLRAAGSVDPDRLSLWYSLAAWLIGGEGGYEYSVPYPLGPRATGELSGMVRSPTCVASIELGKEAPASGLDHPIPLEWVFRFVRGTVIAPYPCTGCGLRKGLSKRSPCFVPLPEGDGLYYSMLDALETTVSRRMSRILPGGSAVRIWREVAGLFTG